MPPVKRGTNEKDGLLGKLIHGGRSGVLQYYWTGLGMNIGAGGGLEKTLIRSARIKFYQ